MQIHWGTLRRALYALAFTLPLVGPLAAQQGSIAGTVRVSEEETAISATAPTLAAVQVRVLDTGGRVVTGTLTTEEGRFRVASVPPGTYNVEFSSPGWRTHVERGIEVVAGQTVSLSVSLTQQVFDLNPITVTASKREEKALDAPAAVSVVSSRDIEEEPAITLADHVKTVPAVDIINTGLQGNYVVVRGFNNIFSGATLTLTDNRIARVPSLRANILYMNPTTNSDIERVEVVLGPGSALYGPNAANGVIHSITKSPIDYPGGSLSIASGFRQQDDVAGVDLGELGAVPGLEGTTEGVIHGEGRYAWRASERFGVKLSGQYFAGQDYLFVDPDEARQQTLANLCITSAFSPTNPGCQALRRGGDETATFVTAVQNVAQGRDPDLKRWSLDARMDWRPQEDLSVILSGGRSMVNNSVDLTGLGAAQVQDWASSYYQARVLYKTLFGQVFLNTSDNTESYLLQSGRPLEDRSYLLVGQLQNSTRFGSRQNFIYGLDVLRTVPRTGGTINGRHEEDDDLTEVGAYVQSETSITDRLDFVGAARVDNHSRLDYVVFSPRAALVYRPALNQTLRVTYNRAFSNPSTLNLFLDISGTTINLGGPFLYDVRAQGTTENGFTFNRDDTGRPQHRSPFAALVGASPTTFLPSTTPQLWAEAVAVVSLSNPQAGALLSQLPVPTEEQVGIDLRTLNTETRAFDPLPGGFAAVPDIPPVDPTITSTLELGYKGLVGGKLLLAANGYYSRIKDFISALVVNTPNVFLNPNDLEAYLGNFVDPATARALAVSIGGGVNAADETVPGIPLGVVTPNEAGGQDPAMILTYRNLGDFDLFGADFAATVLLSDRWEVGATASWVSEDEFLSGEGREDVTPQIVPLNAPGAKGTLSVRYRNDDAGFNAQARGRWVDGFPANSGVYAGQVDSYGVLDVGFGYRIPGLRAMTLQVDVTNVLDDDYQTFVGAPPLGRFTLARLRYEF